MLRDEWSTCAVPKRECPGGGNGDAAVQDICPAISSTLAGIVRIAPLDRRSLGPLATNRLRQSVIQLRQ